MAVTAVQPGDILGVRHKNKIWAWAIRLAGHCTIDHIVIVHHVDAAGTTWGIEGQPGVVAMVDISRWLSDPWTINNAEQPKTQEQRDAVCAGALAMYDNKVPYDWSAIAENALRFIAPLWHRKGEWGAHGTVPVHIICSSIADWLYEQVGLATPDGDQYCTPGDWEKFIRARQWVLAA